MFSWGENSSRGFGFNTISCSNATSVCNGVNYVRLRSEILSLSAGYNTVAFVRTDGKVSVVRIRQDQDGNRVTGKLKHVNCKEKIRAVSCEDDKAILVSEKGRIFSVDTAYTPRPLKILDDRHVSQVACGSQHSIALTKDGNVFTWGNNSRGQLGLGKGAAGVQVPQLLKTLSGISLLKVSAGGDQSFAASMSGSVFGWGKNSCGQLGLGHTRDIHTPTTVQCLNMKRTIDISCGMDHTAIMTKGGTVLTFGSGQYGQLGHNSLRDELRPRVVAELWGAKVTKIACARHHTLVLTDTKRIYSFGRGKQGQLGNGDKSDQSVPQAVQLSEDATAHQQIGQIYAGGNLSFALCSTEEVSQ